LDSVIQKIIMAKEIEKKFLLRNDNWRQHAQGTYYRQGYLSTTKERTVRVRTGGNMAFLTIKGPVKGASRLEFEYPVPLQDAQEILELCEQPLIEKTRYIVMHNGLKWEIDEFEGANKGLILAELELTDENQKFDLPEWIAEEVTGNPDYYNSSLIKKPFSKW
jgi:adenylate cyclase